MATVTGKIFLDTISILEIDGNPTLTGVEASQGSLAIETSSGNMWRKVGTNNTDWVEVFVNQSSPGDASTLSFKVGNNSFNLTVDALTSDVNLIFPGIIGNDGQHLTVRSMGRMQWTNQSSFHPGLISEKYYGSPDLIDVWTTQAVTNNRLYASLLYIPTTTNITRIGCEVTTAVTGSQLRLGLYGLNLNDGNPGDLIVDGGIVSASTIGLKEAIVNINLNAGWYYMAMATSGTPTLRSVAITAETTRSLMGVTAPNTNNQNLNVAFVFDSLPAVFPAVTYTSAARPWLWVRRV